MIHFDEQDRKAWLAFLNTSTGGKLFPFMRENHKPDIRLNGAPHEMQFDLGAQSGFEGGLMDIEAMSRIDTAKKLQTADRPPLENMRRS